MSSIAYLSDPTWLATYAPGDTAYAGLASSLVSEQSTLSAMLAPQPPTASPFFGTTGTLSSSTFAAGTSALSAAEAQDPTLASQVEALSSEGQILNVLA